jgi:hypothetical protein
VTAIEGRRDDLAIFGIGDVVYPIKPFFPMEELNP